MGGGVPRKNEQKRKNNTKTEGDRNGVFGVSGAEY